MAGDRSWLEPTSSCSVSKAVVTVPAGPAKAHYGGRSRPASGERRKGVSGRAGLGGPWQLLELGITAHTTPVIGGPGGTARHSVTRLRVIRSSLRFGRSGDGTPAKNERFRGRTSLSHRQSKFKSRLKGEVVTRTC